jgi:hypothetical protein
MFRKLSLALLMFVTAIMLASCSQSSSASDVVEEYLAAIVGKDDVQAVNLSCAAWEKDARAEGASFEGFDAKLVDVSCMVEEEDGQTATVSCTGMIVFAYAGAEDQERSLEHRNFDVEFEDGEWRMCGYK